MSELPNFKEGFIFDATQNTTTADKPFIVTKSTFTLFKLASIDDYNNNYEYWYYDKNNGETVAVMKIKYYDDFFNSSSLSVGTRAKTFIKDAVLGVAQEHCVVKFDELHLILQKTLFIHLI